MDILFYLFAFGIGLICGSMVEKIKAVKRGRPKTRPVVLKTHAEQTKQYLLGGHRARSN